MGGGRLAAGNVGNSFEIDKLLPSYRWTWNKGSYVFFVCFLGKWEKLDHFYFLKEKISQKEIDFVER